MRSKFRTNNLYKPNNIWVFGTDIYSELKDIIREDRQLDVRSFHTLLDHKRTNAEAVCFLKNEGYLAEPDFTRIYEACTQVHRDTHILRNMVIKYSFVSNAKAKVKLVDRLELIQSIENEALYNLQTALSK